MRVKMKKTLALLAALLLAGCTDPKTATQALENAGFTEIQTGGHSWYTCSDSDTFATKFTAKNPNGKVVSGTVCSGWLKGATIRF
jgi:outer membrane biogenesis lipoprotein LolB